MGRRLVHGALMQGGPNYRELREIIHLLREIGREIKKAYKEFVNDRQNN
ncbi:MAG: hypothetical protein WDN46_08730 [Methylocella sp.]